MSKGHRISKTITANMIIFCAQTGNLLWTHRSNGECDNGIHNEWCVKQLCDSLPRRPSDLIYKVQKISEPEFLGLPSGAAHFSVLLEY